MKKTVRVCGFNCSNTIKDYLTVFGVTGNIWRLLCSTKCRIQKFYINAIVFPSILPKLAYILTLIVVSMKNFKIDRRTKLSVILIFIIIIYFGIYNEYWEIMIIVILLFINENETIYKINIGKDTIEFQRIEALNERKEDLKKVEKEISQYNGPKREEKIKEELEKVFIMGYNSGKGRGPYTINNVKIRRDAHGNIDQIQYDEV